MADEASRLCTVSYRAPELFDPPTNSRLDCRSDVWSLGCLLFAWRFGYSPFECSFSEQGTVRVTECSYSRVLSKLPRNPKADGDDIIIGDICEWILQGWNPKLLGDALITVNVLIVAMVLRPGIHAIIRMWILLSAKYKMTMFSVWGSYLFMTLLA